MEHPRKLILYIAMSLDGYIATSDDGLEFLNLVQQEGEDYGYNDFVNSIDTVIIGRRTYDKIVSLGVPYPLSDKTTYVVTHQKNLHNGHAIFYNGDLQSLVNALKSEKGKNIYCDGGAKLVEELLKDDLIDEFYISIIPVLLGNGIKLFRPIDRETKLRLISSRSFEKGLVQLHYVKD